MIMVDIKHYEEFKNFTVLGVIRAVKYLTIAGHTSPMRFHSVLPSARFSSLLSQSARFSLVASAPKPDNNKQVSNPILKRSWAMLLGIGLALRAVASMRRSVALQIACYACCWDES
ncbi:hypothetical protein Tco_0412751 [Tanacetum coccineum]